MVTLERKEPTINKIRATKTRICQKPTFERNKSGRRGVTPTIIKAKNIVRNKD